MATFWLPAREPGCTCTLDGTYSPATRREDPDCLVHATGKRPCFACSHIHADGPGTCWEAACDPSCRETPECPLPYTPDTPTSSSGETLAPG